MAQLSYVESNNGYLVFLWKYLSEETLMKKCCLSCVNFLVFFVEIFVRIFVKYLWKYFWEDNVMEKWCLPCGDWENRETSKALGGIKLSPSTIMNNVEVDAEKYFVKINGAIFMKARWELRNCSTHLFKPVNTLYSQSSTLTLNKKVQMNKMKGAWHFNTACSYNMNV